MSRMPWRTNTSCNNDSLNSGFSLVKTCPSFVAAMEVMVVQLNNMGEPIVNNVVITKIIYNLPIDY
jgi:hypothetical protein